MDPVWIAIAFALGFAVRQVGLPPLVGFLLAGFVLNAMGVHGGAVIEEVSDLGITLLLFTIGLKLRIRSLLRPQIWASAAIHMFITVIVFGAGIYCFSIAGFSLFSGLDIKLSLLIAFGLSFSSTVFAVKLLEDKAGMSALYGRIAIGILIVQDILAVVFLTASTDKMPSAWAIALIGFLFLARPLIMLVMDRCGHGELLILFGFLLALGGATCFEIVGMKADLGALVLGVLVAGHSKASELAKSLLGFKDLFLVGFFLSIGLSGVPSLENIGLAALFSMALPFKVVLFFFLLARLKLRARTSLMASLSLANYSEFGLIVAAVGVANGWIGNEWLLIIAIALSITFILASPLNYGADLLYARFGERLRVLETATRVPEEELVDPGDAKIAIFGMGRVGTEAYDFMRERYGDTVLGVDVDLQKVKRQQQAGRNVILGDPTDVDFWARVRRRGRAQLCMLAMPKHEANLRAARIMLAEAPERNWILAATAHFDDQVEELKKAGVDAAFNFYHEAGTGFAEHASERLESVGYLSGSTT